MVNYNNPVIQEDLEQIYRAIDWNAFKGKDVLVTGANGHLASYIALTFIYGNRNFQLGVELTVMSRNETILLQQFGEFIDKDEIKFIVADISDPDTVYGEYDYIFHFAGNASPHFIATDPVGILRANIEGAFLMEEVAKRRKDSKLIFASTREVYGKNTTDDILNESAFGILDPIDSRSCYPESKRAAETILEAYRRQYGQKYAIARIAHVYGPGMKIKNDGRVMSDFIYSATIGSDIIMNSDGSALRAFCYISDAVIALLKIAILDSEEFVCNLSNEKEEISIRNLAFMIAKIKGGIKVRLKEVDLATKSLYCAYKRKPLDNSKLEKIGWYPYITLEEGLRRTLLSFESINLEKDEK